MILNSLNTSTLDTQLQTIESELEQCGDIFSSLLNSKSQWESVPEIVFLTFRSIGEFMNKLDSKTNRLGTSLSNGFSKMIKDKVSKQDLEVKILETMPKETEKSRSIQFKLRKQDVLDLETVQEIKNIAHAAIQTKLQQFQYTPSQSPNKNDLGSLIELTQLFNKQLSKLKDSVKVCQTKLLNQAISSPQKRLSTQILNVKNQVYQIQRNLDRKITDRIQSSATNRYQQQPSDPRVQYLLSQMQTFRKMMQQILRSKIDKKQFTEFKNKTTKELLDKIKLQQVEEIIKSIQSELQNRIQDTKTEIRKIEKNLTKQYKHDTEEFKKVLEKLVQNKQPISGVGSSSSLKEIKQSLGRMQRKITDKMFESRDEIAPNVKYELGEELKRFWKKIEDELELRDQKLCQTIEQSKDTLRTQYRTVRSKSNKETSTDKGTEKLLNSICTQLVLGKWLSSKLNNTQLCVWQQQLANTMVQNFKWQQNSTSILLVAQGVYRLQFGFFSPCNSFPSIIINGQVYFKSLDNKSKQIKKHSNGYLNAITVTELILVIPRTKISIQMSKPQNGQSYLGIYKL